MQQNQQAILLIHCEDQPGIIAAVTDFVHQHGGNIIDLDQHTDTLRNKFYMRISWDTAHFDLDTSAINKQFSEQLADRFSMNWNLYTTGKPMRLALLFPSSCIVCMIF